MIALPAIVTADLGAIMETTLIILKPDAVQRGLMGRIISRFEDKGLQIVGAKFMQISSELASTHYSDHQGKPFYDGLVGVMTSSPVLMAVSVRPYRSCPRQPVPTGRRIRHARCGAD